MISSILQGCSKDTLCNMLDEHLASSGAQKFCKDTARHIIRVIRPERVLPENLVRFAPLVTSGIEHFLSSLSPLRLRSVILSLATEQPETDRDDNLIELALAFPTLHKLGQTIARTKGIDPRIKRRLIQLEQRNHGAEKKQQAARLSAHLNTHPEIFSHNVSCEITAEASVATLIPFSWLSHKDRTPQTGICKMLKPEIEAWISEELHALELTAAYLEQHRHELGIENMRLSALFSELRANLLQEVDLAAERDTMILAADVYEAEERVKIPEILPFPAKDMTAMEYLDGMNITLYEGSQDQHHDLASLVFKTIICLPLFSEDESSLFHGDPHAGNILVMRGEPGTPPHIALIDWALAGRLSKQQRMEIIQLLVAVIRSDNNLIGRMICRLAADRPDAVPLEFAALKARIQAFTASTGYHRSNPLKKVFRLLEEMTLLGIVFPSELILYRKAFFTLEGVVNDISPEFSMDECMEHFLGQLVYEEFPLRWAMSVLPIKDEPSYYRSMLSTADLQGLMLQHSLTKWHHMIGSWSALMTAYAHQSFSSIKALTGNNS